MKYKIGDVVSIYDVRSDHYVIEIIAYNPDIIKTGEKSEDYYGLSVIKGVRYVRALKTYLDESAELMDPKIARLLYGF